MPRPAGRGTPSSRRSSASRRARAARARAVGPGGRVAGVAQPLAGRRARSCPRLPIGIGELDRVLGGGLVPGSVVLLGGEPGIGKSTLLLQALAGLVARRPAAGSPVRDRRGVGRARSACARPASAWSTGRPASAIRVVAEPTSGAIVEAAEAEPPAVLVVDSIQTVDRRRARRAGGQRRPGPRGDAPADGAREGRGGRRSSSSAT